MGGIAPEPRRRDQPVAINASSCPVVRACHRVAQGGSLGSAGPGKDRQHQHHLRGCVRVAQAMRGAEIRPVPATADLPVLITRSWRVEMCGSVWASLVRASGAVVFPGNRFQIFGRLPTHPAVAQRGTRACPAQHLEPPGAPLESMGSHPVLSCSGFGALARTCSPIGEQQRDEARANVRHGATSRSGLNFCLFPPAGQSALPSQSSSGAPENPSSMHGIRLPCRYRSIAAL